ncbi:MAG: GPW/gp25 family protein [Ardenticatenaceae bacterium]|nr:GPW/gp25 family protein [Anaerolineales bacterium]MCB9005884.1 GPW/gp25 family protein [Ardenticatenaceae bacterium]
MANELWGTDLRLLQNLDRQHDRYRGRDLSTRERLETGGIDLETLTGTDNLKQALLLRFLTPMGEMAVLGHPNYGSRLSELIGELNSQTNRNRAKMFVLQALAQEPRVAEVLRVDVTAARSNPNQINIDVTLRATREGTILNLVFPFFLDGV